MILYEIKDESNKRFLKGFGYIIWWSWLLKRGGGFKDEMDGESILEILVSWGVVGGLEGYLGVFEIKRVITK